MSRIWKPVERDLRDAWYAAEGEVYWNGYRPIRCPNCRVATLRFYWRCYRLRPYHDGSRRRMGASWSWCPSCHLYFSADGFLPEWWPEEDPVPQVKDLSPNGIDVDPYWEQILRIIAPEGPEARSDVH